MPQTTELNAELIHISDDQGTENIQDLLTKLQRQLGLEEGANMEEILGAASNKLRLLSPTYEDLNNEITPLRAAIVGRQIDPEAAIDYYLKDLVQGKYLENQSRLELIAKLIENSLDNKIVTINISASYKIRLLLAYFYVNDRNDAIKIPELAQEIRNILLDVRKENTR